MAKKPKFAPIEVVTLVDENPKTQRKAPKGKKQVEIKVTKYGRSHTKIVALSDEDITKLDK